MQKRPLVNFDVIAMTNETREAFQLLISNSFEHNFDNPQQLSFSSTSTSRYDTKFPPDLCKKYIVGRLIGKGSCGCVYLGYSKVDPEYQRVAIKVISKSKLNNNVSGTSSNIDATIADSSAVVNEVMKEVDILKRLSGHPCVIQFKEVFDGSSALVIVMELAVGGELFNYVLEDFHRNTFDERVAKLQFYQIVSAVKYLHESNVCHRDIKLENILMTAKSKKSLIKLSDFGLSKFLDGQTVMSTYVGTPSYIAPEVLKTSGDALNSRSSSYTVKADMWSLGCILYSLLCGSPAFHGEDDVELKRNILRGRMNSPTHKIWNIVTDNAKELLKKLLTVNPRMRLSASEALIHPWFTSDPELCQEAEMLMTEGSESTSMGVSTVVNDLRHFELHSTDSATPVYKPIKPIKRRQPEDLNPLSAKRRIITEASL